MPDLAMFVSQVGGVVLLGKSCSPSGRFFGCLVGLGTCSILQKLASSGEFCAFLNVSVIFCFRRFQFLYGFFCLNFSFGILGVLVMFSLVVCGFLIWLVWIFSFVLFSVSSKSELSGAFACRFGSHLC